MSHFGNHMDGVPVKISEKYKRPPKIDLPYSVHECPSRAQQVVDNVKYCFQFENNVLAKIRELHSAKETKKNERRHRLQLLEEAKQKKLDALAAAEAQEKLKQLSVSEVSYPSTEEISEISPDDKADNCDITLTHDQDQEPTITNQNEYSCKEIQTCNNQNEIDLNILQPIQVQSNYKQNDLLDDPDPLQDYKCQTTKYAQYNTPYKQNIDTLTYKDFENDTSSPFDNVELKTINEMELLAQVYSNSSCQVQNPYVDPNFAPNPNFAPVSNCVSQSQMAYIPNTYTEQPIPGQGVVYTPQQYPIINGCYIPQETNCDVNQMENPYMTNYQYYTPPTAYTDGTYYQQPVSVPPETVEYNTVNDTYIPQPHYFYPPQYYQPVTYEVPTQSVESPPNVTASQHNIKSRSRSVPDIVKELDQEVTSARLRASERSYNPSPAPKEVQEPSVSKHKERRSKRKSEHLPNPFDKLSVQLQGVCRRIHSMGFPLDRVARVCTLVGENDKKIIEGLLMMSELMDLGFSEAKVSAALAKHEFNKDKALDDLVS